MKFCFHLFQGPLRLRYPFVYAAEAVSMFFLESFYFSTLNNFVSLHLFLYTGYIFDSFPLSSNTCIFILKMVQTISAQIFQKFWRILKILGGSKV